MEDMYERKRWVAIGRLALDLRDSMTTRSVAELGGVRSALSGRPSAGHAEELVIAEALAAAAEAVRRVTGYVCTERNLQAAVALYGGHAVEIADDGVNSIISTLPAFLSAASGTRVHVVSADEHLAARGFRQSENIYALLGVTCSMAPPDSAPLEDHQRAFDAEVTFGSYLQMAYQYLGNHLAQDRREVVGWAPQLAVVDQVDAVLIDHADDPLFIRAPMQPDTEYLGQMVAAAAELNRGAEFDIDNTTGHVSWSYSGLQRAASLLRAEQLDGIGAALIRRQLEEALRARHLYRRGTDYTIEQGRIITRSTADSKLAESPHLRSGVLQAIEAREGVPISAELVVLARITVCDYFRLYERLAGLSGEAAHAAEQLEQLYQLKAISLRDEAASRVDHPDVLFEQADARLNALVADAVEAHRAGQPVVIGAQSIDDARLAVQMLTKSGVRPALLAGGGQDADIAFANAGDTSAITVLAGRVPHGYDIDIRRSQAAGGGDEHPHGLAVLAAGRSRSWRSDHWLQGLAGRRGSAGESRFYLSAQDPLLAGSQSQVMKWIPAAIRRKADGAAVGPREAHVIANLQQKAFSADFQRLLDSLAFEGVETEQRREIYRIRDEILLHADASDYVNSLMEQIATIYVRRYQDRSRLLKRLARLYPPELSDGKLARSLSSGSASDVGKMIEAELRSAYRIRAEFIGSSALHDMERRIALAVLGSNWRQQLLALESMRIACSFSERPADLLPEYRREATRLYGVMRDRIAEDTLGYLFHSDSPANTRQ